MSKPREIWLCPLGVAFYLRENGRRVSFKKCSDFSARVDGFEFGIEESGYWVQGRKGGGRRGMRRRRRRKRRTRSKKKNADKEP